MAEIGNQFAQTARATTGSGVANTQEGATANFDTFLKLLTVQLQNQDPLNPMEGTEFTEQIATFSSLEQQIAQNSKLDKLVEQREFGAQSVALSMMGKDALAPGSTAKLENGKMDLAYELEETAVEGTIEIFDPTTGAKLQSFDANKTKGVHALEWDGATDQGQQAEDGIYLVKFSAFNREGAKVGSRTFSFGEVVSVESLGKGADGTTLLLNDGRAVGFNDVLSVRQPVETIVEQSDDA